MPVSRRDVLKYLGLSGALPALSRLATHRQLIADRISDRDSHRFRSIGQTTFIPFTRYGRPGRVAVTYGVTEDMLAEGYDVVLPPGFDPTFCRGYPTVRAVIDRYDGGGYSTISGWIQIVTGKYYGPGGDTTPVVETSTSVDKLPSMMDVDVPFLAFGNSPQAFDAPCRNLNDHVELHWQAETFLTTVPIRSREEEIHQLLGFRWGYREFDAASHRPVAPLALEVTGAGAWNALLPVLRKNYPHWRFASG